MVNLPLRMVTYMMWSQDHILLFYLCSLIESLEILSEFSRK